MRRLFVDTAFWIAWIDPHDVLHEQVGRLAADIFAGPVHLVTTDAVLYEVLAFFSRGGSALRGVAAQTARDILSESTVQCVQVDRQLLDRGLALYEQRSDKTYSLTDCISMIICRDQGIIDVLTSDKDFEQEGFNRLLAAPA